MLISLVEYAAMHGKNRTSAVRMANRGGFNTARKIGRNRVIETSEARPDKQVKSGKYIGWRKPEK